MVGDRVRVRGPETEALVVAVHPRRNRYVRRAPGGGREDQIVAANLDLVVAVVAAAQPKPRWGIVDRMLVSAAAAGIEAAVCLTKIDLVSPSGTARDAGTAALAAYQRAGFRCEAASSLTGQGLDEVRALLAGRRCLLVGNSGAGKTTLIGALCGLADLRARPVNPRTGKGRHTTTAAQSYALPQGGWVVDTPGFKAFALPALTAEQITAGYPEIRAALGACRFGAGCTHTHEPDCGVKRAVAEGRVHPERYRSFVKLARGAGGPHGGRSAGGRADKRRCAPTPSGDFTCARCGQAVGGIVPGSAHRNHCPACLWSLHVDQTPGDRAAGCEGAMEPIAVEVRSDGEWALVHRCTACGELKTNRIAGDDNPALLMSLAARPMARPPFPLDRSWDMMR